MASLLTVIAKGMKISENTAGFGEMTDRAYRSPWQKEQTGEDIVNHLLGRDT